jgi:hypothetical protein
MKVGLLVDRSDGKGGFNKVDNSINNLFGDLEINYFFLDTGICRD